MEQISLNELYFNITGTKIVEYFGPNNDILEENAIFR